LVTGERRVIGRRQFNLFDRLRGRLASFRPRMLPVKEALLGKRVSRQGVGLETGNKGKKNDLHDGGKNEKILRRRTIG